MSEQSSPILNVDLGDNGGMQLYRTVAELEEWFKAEKDFWGWLQGVNWNAINKRGRGIARQLGLANQGLGQGGCDKQLASLNKIDRALQLLRANPNSQQNRDEVKAVVLATYAPTNGDAPNAIHSASSNAEVVNAFRQEYPSLGANALAIMLSVPEGILSVDEVEAICRVALYNQGVKDTATAEKASLERLLSEWRAELAAAKTQFDTECAQMAAQQSSEEAKALQRQKGFDGFMEEAKAAQAKALASSQQELASIEETYNEKLALQASVSYWTKKASKHTFLAWGFAVVSAIVFGLGGGAIYKSMSLLMGAAKINEVEVWKLGVVVILATVVVWAIRVAVRLLMSNIHLHDDAEERTTMLLTYLAMLREGKLPEGDVRQLILQALFRPAATGIVKDDATPPFMAQWLKATTGVDQNA